MPKIYEPIQFQPRPEPQENPLDLALKFMQANQDRKLKQEQMARENRLYEMQERRDMANQAWAEKERARTETDWQREDAFKKDVVSKVQSLRASGITDPMQVQIQVFRDLAPTYGDLRMFQQGLQHAKTLKEFQPTEEIMTINGVKKRTRTDPITGRTEILEEETPLTGRAKEQYERKIKESDAEIALKKAHEIATLRKPQGTGEFGVLDKQIDNQRQLVNALSAQLELKMRAPMDLELMPKPEVDKHFKDIEDTRKRLADETDILVEMSGGRGRPGVKETPPAAPKTARQKWLESQGIIAKGTVLFTETPGVRAAPEPTPAEGQPSLSTLPPQESPVIENLGPLPPPPAPRAYIPPANTPAGMWHDVKDEFGAYGRALYQDVLSPMGGAIQQNWNIRGASAADRASRFLSGKLKPRTPAEAQQLLSEFQIAERQLSPDFPSLGILRQAIIALQGTSGEER